MRYYNNFAKDSGNDTNVNNTAFKQENYYDKNPLPQIFDQNGNPINFENTYSNENAEGGMPFLSFKNNKKHGFLVGIIIVTVLIVVGIMIFIPYIYNAPPEQEQPFTTIEPDYENDYFNNLDKVDESETEQNPYTSNDFSLSVPVNLDETLPLLTPEELYNTVVKSVVKINTYSTDENGNVSPVSEATGFIISNDGYIITNAHVISSADKFVVTLNNKTDFVAHEVGKDFKSDLAVIKIDPKGYQLTVATLGNSDNLRMGQQVFAIGNPGDFEFSLTGGYVSGLKRNVKNLNGMSVTCIQTDATLNPGNSGGPLINMYGQIIGINSFIYIGSQNDYQNMNFSISINDAVPILNSIIKYGHFTGNSSPKLGITFIGMTSTIAEIYNTIPGLKIVEISEDCDIASTDLQVNDIITKVQDKPVCDYDELFEIIKDKKPGDTLTAEVKRKTENGEYKTFTIEFKLMES